MSDPGTWCICDNEHCDARTPMIGFPKRPSDQGWKFAAGGQTYCPKCVKQMEFEAKRQ
jgi:hypothetical protein